MSLLGIDIGTTGSKAAVFSENGQCLASTYQEYATIHPEEGWSELDSSHVFDCVKKIISEVAVKTDSDPIKALSVSSMGEAMVPVSRDRKILGSSILCSDTRGAEFIKELKSKISQEEFYKINPNILGTNYSLPKLLWIKKHQPRLYEQADKFLLWGDLVGFMLGSEPITSYSLANRTLLFDVKKEDWSENLLNLSGIDRIKLPVPMPSGTVTGVVDSNLARELNLPENVKIVVGGHDQCCNSLGAGICQAGQAVCGIGSFECITPAFDAIPEASLMLKGGLNIEHHVLTGLYVSFIYNQGGLLLRWFRDTFASADKKHLEQGEDIYNLLSQEMPPEPTELLTLPYFEMTGPPDFTADASGVIMGLKTSTTRGEILKSIMECETFYFIESLNYLKSMGIDTSEFIATGGGAKSDQWLQIKANIFGIPFVRPSITEAGVLGAAILAGSAVDVFNSSEEGALELVKRNRIFEPDKRQHELYKEKYEKYKALYPLLKDFLAQL